MALDQLILGASGICKAAVVQAAPVSFDRARTLEKVADLAAEARGRSTQLTLFPEAFVSAYPRGLGFGAVVGARTAEGREQYRLYWESAIDVPGPHVDQLSEIARTNGTHLIIGVIERDGGTSTARSCSSGRMDVFSANIES
jgi:nitrilase